MARPLNSTFGHDLKEEFRGGVDSDTWHRISVSRVKLRQSPVENVQSTDWGVTRNEERDKQVQFLPPEIFLLSEFGDSVLVVRQNP